jgi:hypothetical protein
MNGYAGKILRLDLTTRKISVIPTSDYAKWGGGHGMGSAIFFNLVKDKTIDGFDPADVVTPMTSPLCGTITPAAGGRTEMQGVGMQSSPIGWYTRSNFGGRFSSQLKFAGWNGIVIAAIGVPGFITSRMIKDGVVVIDVGTNRVPDKTKKSGFRLAGDVDFKNVSKKARAITPVPGGVGPMTITMLMRNTVDSAKRGAAKRPRR